MNRSIRRLTFLGALLTLSACTPYWLVRHIAANQSGCLYFADTREPIVALTLDDGPDSATTAEILEVLAENRARATFFLISSRVPGNEALVAKLVRDGHEIGNHFVSDQPSIRLSPMEFERSLVEADSVLSRFATLRWARPASGWYNERMIQTMSQHGYRCALGSVYPFDPLIPWVSHSVRVVLGHVRPGAIIVLHDSGPRGRRTAEALRQILPELTRRGYRVTTLSELIAHDTGAGTLRRARGVPAA